MLKARRKRRSTAEPFVMELGEMVRCHQPECGAKRRVFGRLVQGQLLTVQLLTRRQSLPCLQTSAPFFLQFKS